MRRRRRKLLMMGLGLVWMMMGDDSKRRGCVLMHLVHVIPMISRVRRRGQRRSRMEMVVLGKHHAGRGSGRWNISLLR